MRHGISRIRTAFAILTLAILFHAAPPAAQAPVPTPTLARAPALAHLGGIDELKSWFNAGKGHPRLIFLLSPT